MTDFERGIELLNQLLQALGNQSSASASSAEALAGQLLYGLRHARLRNAVDEPTAAEIEALAARLRQG